MKTKKIIPIICIYLLAVSCSLDEKLYDTPSVNSFIQGEKDVYNQLTGIYGLMSSYGSYKFQLNSMITYGGDDICTTTAVYRVFPERTASPSNAYFTAPWGIFYQVINNSNSLMVSLQQADMLSDDFKRRIMGELYFLRGYAYFNLVRLYGGVPLRTSPTDGDSDFYPKVATSDEIYQQLLEDLKLASEQCIPFSKQPADEFGRATKGAAQGTLAKAWLTYGNMKDLANESGSDEAYQHAKDYADTVIKSNEYSLISNYADLWDVNKEKDAYKEVIFGIQFTRDNTAASASSKGSEYAWFYEPSNRDHVCGNVTDGNGAGTIKIQPWFYDLYNIGEYEGDYRTEVSFLVRWTNGITNKIYITYPELRQTGESVTVQQFPYIDKYKDPDGLQARNNENDLFVLRLSEIYLIRAEAENELHGTTPEAYSDFNKLRERARMADGTPRSTPENLQPGLSPEEFRLKIFQERGLEFVGEGQRWFDGVRMRYTDNVRPMIQYQYEDFLPSLDSRAPAYSTATNTWGGGKVQPLNIVPFSKKFLIWPIPSPEIDANPNLSQNEGW